MTGATPITFNEKMRKRTMTEDNPHLYETENDKLELISNHEIPYIEV